jgi:hypothetical protein
MLSAIFSVSEVKFPFKREFQFSHLISHGVFWFGQKIQMVRQSKRFVPGFLVGIKGIGFVGRSEAETP